jgi:5-methylcytosine-specific restriction enzyme B
MLISDRISEFVTATQGAAPYTAAWRTYTNHGISNSARIIEGGLFVSGPNLDSYHNDAGGLLFPTLIRFPSGDEVHFALYVESALPDFHTWLGQMTTLAATDPNNFAARNNNVKLYLAPGNRLFARNKYPANQHQLVFDTTTAGPAFPVDRLAYAVYPPSVSGWRSLHTREFVDYLTQMVGAERIRDMRLWEHDISPLMKRNPAGIGVTDITAAVAAQGGYYTDDLVERFHIALNHLSGKHFVILAGISGTGKTGLVQRYARAVHGISDPTEEDPLLFLCAVRPDWTDPSGLLGSNDPLSESYVVPTFLRAVLTAQQYPDSPVFAVLDEMNLARVEYYLADVLSAMESRDRLMQLHPFTASLTGSHGHPVEPWTKLPENLYLVGTINVDETTQPVSDKVLDRAVVIDTSKVDLQGYFDKLKTDHQVLAQSIDECRALLQDTHAALEPHGLGFGYRVAEEVVRYFRFAMQVRTFLTPADRQQHVTTVLDHLLTQKVLVKLRGTEKQHQMLQGLQTLLAAYPRSLETIKRLHSDLEELGSFQNMR